MIRTLKTSLLVVTAICLTISCKKKMNSEDEELKDSIPTTIQSQGSGTENTGEGSSTDADMNGASADGTSTDANNYNGEHSSDDNNSTSGNRKSLKGNSNGASSEGNYSSESDYTSNGQENASSSGRKKSNTGKGSNYSAKGKYSGTVSLKNGKVANVNLNLTEDSKFQLEIKYLGKNNGKPVLEQGTYSKSEDGTITLNGVTSIPNKLTIQDNSIVFEEEGGTNGKSKRTYALTKKTSKVKSKKEIMREINEDIGMTSDETSTSGTKGSKSRKGGVIQAGTVFKSIGSTLSSTYSLAGTKWKLVEWNGKAVKSTSKDFSYIIIQSNTEKISGMLGCTNFSGNYMMQSAFNISFANLSEGAKSCAKTENDNAIMESLQKVDSYAILNGKILQLNKNLVTPVAKFEATN